MHAYITYTFVCIMTNVSNKPSAAIREKRISNVHTCTENDLSLGTGVMTVNDILCSDSFALLALLRNCTAVINNKTHHDMIQLCKPPCKYVSHH